MKLAGKILGHVAIGVVAIGVFTLVFMLLWNWLLPLIFGITAIGFWQALGILVLSKILFGGFGGRRYWGHKRNHLGRGGHHSRIREKWLKMSDEERQEFLKHRRNFGFGRDFFENEESKNED